VADKKTGLGHLLRCRVLLLEMARRGWAAELIFLGPPSILKRWDWPESIKITCEGESVSIGDVRKALAQKLANNTVDWVIIDGYDFRGTSWRTQVNIENARLLMLDDIGDQVFTADAVLNPNGTNQDYYLVRGINAELWMLGSEYALIEPVYIAPKEKKLNEVLKRVLVVFGGADKRQMTPKSVDSLLEIDPTLQLDVVLGPYSTWSDLPVEQTNLVFHYAPAGLAELMLQADLIVTAAGSTAWQACAAGCPSIVVQTVDNQAQIVATLLKSDAALLVGAEKLNSGLADAVKALRSVEAREAMVQKARRLVDGKGARRVVDAMVAW